MLRGWPLTVRGTGAVVLAVACLAVTGWLGLVELRMAGMLLLGLVAGCLVWVRAGRRPAEVTRLTRPDAPSTGAEVVVTVRVRMLSAVATPAGRWADAVPPGLSGGASGVFPPLAAAWSRAERAVELSYRLSAERRGEYLIGPLAVELVDPFGIARRTVSLGAPTRVVVAPAPVALTSLGAIGGRSGGAQATPANRYGQGTDDLVARRWMPGDSMRRIHWRASAHRDELMVRQEERETSPEALVVFDRALARFSADALDRPGADPAFETAVTACASALARLARDGYTVQVVDAATTPLCGVVAAGDEAAIEAALTTLADVRAQPDGDLRLLRTRLAGEGGIGPLVLVTGRIDPADAAELSPLARRSSLPVLLAVDADDGALAHAQGWRGGAIPVTDVGTPDADWARLAGPVPETATALLAQVWAGAVTRIAYAAP